MKVVDVVIGETYCMKVRHRAVKGFSPDYVDDGYTKGYVGTWSAGFPAFTVMRSVVIVERVGQHFIAESVQYRALGRDRETMKITGWDKYVLREHVYARELFPLGSS